MNNVDTIDIFNEVVGRHMGGKLIPIAKYGSPAQTFTPQWIVKDMIALLPDQVWNENTTFLDISCKTGVFLIEIYKKLDEVLAKNPKYADTATRRSHILNEQLYGLALDNEECLWYSSRNVYGRIGAKNMKYIHAGGNDSGYSYEQLVKYKKVEYMKALIQEEFGRNMFDVVVGNPPYNNDIYLDFVTLAKAIQTQNVCMITPAKWQAKGGPKNEAFRRDIFPFMDKIVYYPDCSDIFEIGEVGGLSYYSMTNATVNKHNITEICKKNEKLNSVGTIQNLNSEVLDIVGNDVIKKLGNFEPLKIKGHNMGNKHKIYANNLAAIGGSKKQGTYLLSKDGKLQLLAQSTIIHDIAQESIFSGNFHIIYTSDTESECDSAISYIKTRFIRFLLFCGRCGNSMMAEEAWRFVPDPGAFDHIFTDDELYKKYNLTKDEIDLIESVIKERK